MKYSFNAIVNYPEQDEIDTPSFKASCISDLERLFLKLIRDEPEATSFVITIAKFSN